MKQENSFDFEKDYLTPAELDRIARQAMAARDAALGHAVRAAWRAVAAAPGCFVQAVEKAYRLRALALMNDRKLAAMGLVRADLPAHVYDWVPPPPTVRLTDVVAAEDRDTGSRPPDRLAA